MWWSLTKFTLDKGHYISVIDIARYGGKCKTLVCNNNWHKYSMKPSGFDIIELFRNNYKLEAHAMNKSITEATQDDKRISKSIKRFFTRFHVSSALKVSHAYKKKGIPVTEIFQYLFLLIFSNRSMYMNLITGRNTPGFAKDISLVLPYFAEYIKEYCGQKSRLQLTGNLKKCIL